MTNTFEDIIAWQKAREFIRHVYQITRSFPDDEKYGLTSQFRRASISIAANIAEGYKRIGRDGKLRFLNYSQGSLEECRCYVILCRDIGYISDQDSTLLIQQIEETSKLLNGYSNAINNRKKWED